MKCVSVANMRISDAYTIGNFVPSLELMRRAAWGVFKAHNWDGTTAIVVGSGNNGGDGFALACILQKHGHSCSVFTVSQNRSGDSAYYEEKAKVAGISVKPFEKGCLAGFTTVVDCLLGTGFSGPLRDNYRVAIEEINTACAYVISVDINSGMHGDTGTAELAVKSDLTVTIGYVKQGMVKPLAGRFIKRLVCADIGIILLWEAETITEDTRPQWLDMNVIDAMH